MTAHGLGGGLLPDCVTSVLVYTLEAGRFFHFVDFDKVMHYKHF